MREIINLRNDKELDKKITELMIFYGMKTVSDTIRMAIYNYHRGLREVSDENIKKHNTVRPAHQICESDPDDEL